MARKLSSREIGLMLSLAGAAVLYLWYRSGPAEPTGGEAAAAAARAAAAERPPQVRMDLLAKDAEGYDPEGRDLFKYAVRPPSAEELRQRRLEEERQRKLMEEEARRRAEDAARQAQAQKERDAALVLNPPKPQPPNIDLRYVGYIGPKDDKVAVFQDGEDILVGKKGETVKGQFKIVDIKLESVVMGYTRSEFRDVTRELSLAPSSPR